MQLVLVCYSWFQSLLHRMRGGRVPKFILIHPAVPVAQGISDRVFDRRIRPSGNFLVPVTCDYTLTIEQQFASNWAMRVAYVVSGSRHQFVNLELNPEVNNGLGALNPATNRSFKETEARSVRKLLRSLDDEACCLGGLGSARVVGLRAANRKPIAAGLHGANAIRIHLGELSRVQHEDDVPDCSRREVETLKALQL